MKNFGNVPAVRYNRSKFDLSHGVKTSMSVGKLYPLKVLEVLPGDTFRSDMKAVLRCTSAFLKPIADNLFMDVYHFFVPYRLVFDDAAKVFGNPNPSSWTANTRSDFPTCPVTKNPIVSPGSVADYLGLPVSLSATDYCTPGYSILPFRAFAKIYNDWFRNENVIDEVYIQKGAYSNTEDLNNNVWSSSNYTGQLPNVSKKKDYFTSCLQSVQRGPGVNVPLGSMFAPVITRDPSAMNESSNLPLERLYWSRTTDGTRVLPSAGLAPVGPAYTENGATFISSDEVTRSAGNAVVPRNLWADLTSNPVNVADLRTAFQLQKMLEKDSRYGVRYNEFLLGHFGVTSPDARLQFSEFLGGGRIPVQFQTTLQTSEGTATSPQSNPSANSLSFGTSKYSKGFVEHGYVFTVGCIRQIHTYQQGIPRHFFRHTREEFYDPLLANISEQPVYKAQLYGKKAANSTLTANVFGYNEAWADYRYEPSIVTGQMRSGVTNSLEVWHLADKYNGNPTLNQAFVEENSANIDRVLAVPSSSQDNFLLDAWFNVSAIRVMPVYSVPGLVDHH